jgi:hypothetical protein
MRQQLTGEGGDAICSMISCALMPLTTIRKAADWARRILASAILGWRFWVSALNLNVNE